jgi:hypothetical protein
MARLTAETGTMIDRIGQAVAAADNGDFEVDKARYRRLASVALKPLTRPSEAMVDAAIAGLLAAAFWFLYYRQANCGLKYG